MVASEHEDKSIGAIIRESFRQGMDDANARRQRTVEAKRIAAGRSLAQTEHRLRELLAAIASGTGDTDPREKLATEINVWQALYDDWRKAAG